MKPFDLEAAKRGEPIQVCYDGQWTDAHFVGLNELGYVVSQGSYRCGEYSSWTKDNVRMAPKKRAVYVNIWKGEMPRGSLLSTSPTGAHVAHWFDTEQLAEKAAYCGAAKGPSSHCLAVAVPVLITE